MPPSLDEHDRRPPLTRLALWAERLVSRLAWRLTRAYTALDRATDGLLPLLARGWVAFTQRDIRYAASLAYYALFSIFPLLLLAITLISGLLGPRLAREQVIQFISSFFPPETAGFIADNVQLVLRQRQPFGIVAAIGLAWSGLSLFSNLTVAIDNIFHPTYWRPLWRKRLLAVIMVVVLAALLIGSLITSLGLRLVSALLLDRGSVILQILNLSLPLGLNLTIFVLLFRYIPRVRVRWDAIWPAAILGSLGWNLAQGLFVWYLDNFSLYSVVYGSLAAVIVLLLWVYVSSAILLLAAELCNAINTWLERRGK